MDSILIINTLNSKKPGYSKMEIFRLPKDIADRYRTSLELTNGTCITCPLNKSVSLAQMFIYVFVNNKDSLSVEEVGSLIFEAGKFRKYLQDVSKLVDLSNCKTLYNLKILV